jgi:hypothetical protein
MRPITLPPGAHSAWQLLADMHKPADQGAIAQEIRRLHATGLKSRDIAQALRLDIAVVLEALRATP